MKTPKRDYKAPASPQRQDIVDCTLERWKRCKEARWKRKNRIIQLKRSLTRYMKGTHLPFYSHELHAYLLLQHLSCPSKKATAEEWTSYILELTAIRRLIEAAERQALRAEQKKREEEAQKEAK